MNLNLTLKHLGILTALLTPLYGSSVHSAQPVTQGLPPKVVSPYFDNDEEGLKAIKYDGTFTRKNGTHVTAIGGVDDFQVIRNEETAIPGSTSVNRRFEAVIIKTDGTTTPIGRMSTMPRSFLKKHPLPAKLTTTPGVRSKKTDSRGNTTYYFNGKAGNMSDYNR